MRREQRYSGLYRMHRPIVAKEGTAFTQALLTVSLPNAFQPCGYRANEQARPSQAAGSVRSLSIQSLHKYPRQQTIYTLISFGCSSPVLCSGT